ncbi:MAG: PIG-L family deacetylase [Ilumatobacter sp.]|jgi:LmbE family N-acetylglucosaminyl deacetylase|uniref:PIG-L deacetylase family protein n=2 Tax=Ilumatobacter sp. TaxID=1967498 RepID=UPI002A2FFB18|nr:PIG-L family deacetylase [Ilumatobacter sp.]MDG1392715.1 PIG-L family deacetylase [Ilumatobacter sp.]MDG2234330.1 PIG-L family deacetylase [Ilumatobacter sp.]
MGRMMDFSEIERVLVVTAHPDDVDFGAAGTVANMTDAGIEVVYCLVTDGQAGGFDHSIPRTEMAAIRREEQTKAAAEVGVTRLIFLGHMDGEAVADMQLRHDISAAIREVRPQVVITQNPVRNLDSTYGSHPDHIATGEATMCAVYPDARNPFAFAGQPCAELDDWAVDEVWVMLGADAHDFIDITSQLDRKIRALRCHESQHRDPDAMEERVRAWWKSIAAERGRPENTSAEVFRVVDTR